MSLQETFDGLTQAPEDAHTRTTLHKVPTPNTAWMEGAGTWVTYSAILVLTRLLLALVPLPPVIAWSVWNVGHSLVTFVAFHWIKGDPYDEQKQGISRKGLRLTLWEQLDFGVQYTKTRKFLTVVPVAMFYITSHYTNFDRPALLINSAAFLLILIAKLPFMQKRRLLNID